MRRSVSGQLWPVMWCVPLMLVFQRSGLCLCAWAAGTRSTTSTSCGSPRTWSGTPPVSNVPSAASTWTSPARASSGTERRTVNGTTSGRTAGTGRDDPFTDKTEAGTARRLELLLFYISVWQYSEWFQTHGQTCFHWIKWFSMLWTLSSLLLRHLLLLRHVSISFTFIRCFKKTNNKKKKKTRSTLHQAFRSYLLAN